ncbi:MAG TPA: helix-turn-helix domain-containing protein [Candidatus Polarisedimenticolaceae bacterium]|nr:helix-turn-helix domain-containing protein [Candidatus Polarisedimenticolaceae bacterium]
MGSAAIRASKRLGEFLRRKRQGLGLTLRDVAVRTAEEGERLPGSTLVRIEQGKLDPGVRRLHLLMRLYDLAPHELAERLELETQQLEPPAEPDPHKLYERGIELWQEGQGLQALNQLLAVRESTPRDAEQRVLRQRAALASATIAHRLGKTRVAKQMLDDLLCEPPDVSMELDCFVLCSSLWRALGSQEMATLMIEHALGLSQAGPPSRLAEVLYRSAKLHHEAGRHAEATDRLERALRHYLQLGDAGGLVRAQLLEGGILAGLGRREEGIQRVRVALAAAEAHGEESAGLFCRLELGRLLFADGQREAGIAELTQGLAAAVRLADAPGRFHAHLELWRAHSAEGNAARAALELDSARYYAQFVDEAPHELQAAGAPAGEAGRPVRRRRGRPSVEH